MDEDNSIAYRFLESVRFGLYMGILAGGRIRKAGLGLLSALFRIGKFEKQVR